MNKKAIMVQFLVTVLLAIIIFAPACMFVSKFLRISEQAGNNFLDFVKEVQDLAEKGQDKEIRGFILILDEGTSLVYFEKDQLDVKLNINAGINGNYQILFEKPLEPECSSEPCLCLFKNAEIEADNPPIKIIPDLTNFKNIVCYNKINNLKLENCGIGMPKGADSYQCSGGFVIERLVVKEAIGKVPIPVPKVYFELGRRTALQLFKEDKIIILKQQK